MNCTDNTETTNFVTLFPEHVFNPEDREESILSNITIDWYYGHRDILEKIQIPKYAALVRELKNAPMEEIKHRAEKARQKSVLMTALFLTGKCDADCSICYTDRRYKPTDLNLGEIEEIINQTARLGNKTIYIPGEGEPFLDRNIFEIIEFATRLGQNVVIFTDGLLISDEERFKKQCGFELEEFFELVKRSPLYLYVKYWHSNRVQAAKMMGIPPERLRTETVILQNGNKIDVPKGLLNLIKIAPEKAGIETAVHKPNFDDVFEHIMPFVKDFGIRWYLEPIIHSGRYFGRHEYDLTTEQHLKISPYLTKQQCKRTGFSTVITATGHLTFCPSFLTHLSVENADSLKELSVRQDGQEGIRDIFNIMHSNKFLVESRYAAYSRNCLCEYIANKSEVGRAAGALLD
ncbi:MAG: hypothetical protein JST85_22430 [Acidobacteria bacterium]|nr:hypothetical protein [Acidobacteriota bacterium]